MKRAFRDTATLTLSYEIACAMIRRRGSSLATSENQRLSSPAQDDGIFGLDMMDWKLANASSQDSGVRGLGAVPEVSAKKLGASPSTQPPVKTEERIKPISAQDLAKMRFKTIGYHGRFKDVISDPAIGFHMMVYGKPFQGKSSFVIELCKDLAALKQGRIAYLALKEGISASMQKKVIDRGAADVSGIDFIGSMIPSFDGYRFVVIDSVSDRSLKREALRELF